MRRPEVTTAAAATVDLSVVIVTHNGRELALATIESAMSGAAGVAVEWIVVDSGSTDGTPDAIAARWPDIVLQRLDNVGFAAANNAGFRLCRGRYVLALNPDTELRRGGFADLVAALDARPDVGAASVIQEEPVGYLKSIRRDPSIGRQLSEALHLRRLPGCGAWQERQLDQRVYERDLRADWLVGAFLVLRREALADVGGFDEDFFMYSEEADLCRRVRAAGWDVRHLPVMRIFHHGGSPNPRLMAQSAFSRLLYASKHFDRKRAVVFRAVLALHHALRFAGQLVRGGDPERRTGEARALRVVLGLEPPPFAGPR